MDDQKKKYLKFNLTCFALKNNNPNFVKCQLPILSKERRASLVRVNKMREVPFCFLHKETLKIYFMQCKSKYCCCFFMNVKSVAGKKKKQKEKVQIPIFVMMCKF